MLSNLRKRFRAASKLAQRHGRIALAKRAVTLCGDRAMNLEVTTVMRMNADQVIDAPTRFRNATFTFLTPNEIESYASCEEYDLRNEHAEAVRSGRAMCCGGFVDGRLAHYSWYHTPGEYAFDDCGLHIVIPDDTAYLCKAFTLPDFRGHHLFPQTIALVAGELRSRGTIGIVVDVNWTNWSSLYACRRVGFEPLGNVINFGLGHRRLCWVPSRAPACGINFVRHARATSAIKTARLTEDLAKAICGIIPSSSGHAPTTR